MEELKVTSLSELEIYGKGQIVRFPDFAEGQPFVARIKRPSMLVLSKLGKIPNSLMKTANKLFAGNGITKEDEKNEQMMKDLFGVLDVICEACFVEPTFAQIKEAGIELTDEQMMFVFNYTQKGVRALEKFRAEQRYYQRIGNGEEIQKTTV